jgi:hypothetical protein
VISNHCHVYKTSGILSGYIQLQILVTNNCKYSRLYIYIHRARMCVPICKPVFIVTDNSKVSEEHLN